MDLEEKEFNCISCGESGHTDLTCPKTRPKIVLDKDGVRWRTDKKRIQAKDEGDEEIPEVLRDIQKKRDEKLQDIRKIKLSDGKCGPVKVKTSRKPKVVQKSSEWHARKKAKLSKGREWKEVVTRCLR